MRAHHRPHFVQNRSSSPIFQRDWVHVLFCDDRSRLRAQKNRRSLQYFKTTRPFHPLLRTWIMPPYPAAVCNFCSFDSFSVFFARDHSGSSPERRHLARSHFDRDAPCLFRSLNTTDSHDKPRYRFCNLGKKQLFHVKHRFLQCFSLEFYLLFALSLLPHCLMFHLFAIGLTCARLCALLIDDCGSCVFCARSSLFLVLPASSRSFAVCSGVRTDCF